MENSILLTGATGYLGSKLGRRLLENGYRIIAVHLNHEEEEEFKYDLNFSSQVKRVYLSDVTIEEIFRNDVRGIIHTSTLYGRSGETVTDLIKANVIFPVELLTNAVKNNVEFFINTDTILNKYISPYALTKSSVTDWMKFYADDIKMIDIKLDHFYGPKDKNTKFIASVLEKLLNNEEEIDLTEGKQTRDFMYVEDVIEIYNVVLANIDKMMLGQINVFEAGTDKKTSIRYVAEKLKELTGSSTKLNFGAIPYRKNEMLDYDINTTAIRLLGWRPKVSIEEGLKKVVEAEKVFA